MKIISKFQIMLLISIIGFTTLLFYTSYITHNNKIHIKLLQKTVLKKQKQMQILKTQLSFLKNPERLKNLVKKQLPNYVPINKIRLVSWKMIENTNIK